MPLLCWELWMTKQLMTRFFICCIFYICTELSVAMARLLVCVFGSLVNYVLASVFPCVIYVLLCNPL